MVSDGLDISRRKSDRAVAETTFESRRLVLVVRARKWAERQRRATDYVSDGVSATNPVWTQQNSALSHLPRYGLPYTRPIRAAVEVWA